MMAGRPGAQLATSLRTKATRARINSTTARSTPGSSNVYGSLSLLSAIRTPYMRVLKTRPCSARKTAARPGRSWRGCERSKEISGSQAQEGCVCIRSCSTRGNPKRIFTAISAAGAFRSEDEGQTWKAVTHGLLSNFELPDPSAEVGHCVHSIAMHPSQPNTLFMQKHWDVMRSDDSGDNWYEVSDNLPSDFGFPIAVHAHEPETIYVIPIKSDSEHFPPEGKLRVYRSRSGGNAWEALTNGLPQENCYVNVLRSALSVDKLDPCGVYFGTTGGQVYASADNGEHWTAIVHDLPAVLSVEAQVLA